MKICKAKEVLSCRYAEPFAQASEEVICRCRLSGECRYQKEITSNIFYLIKDILTNIKLEEVERVRGLVKDFIDSEQMDITLYRKERGEYE